MVDVLLFCAYISDCRTVAAHSLDNTSSIEFDREAIKSVHTSSLLHKHDNTSNIIRTTRVYQDMTENDASIAGAAHLNTLRKYLARMSQLVREMEAFAVLTVSEPGHDKHAQCQNLVRTATIVQSVVGKVTDISEPVFDSLNMSQSLQLTDLMNRLEECNMQARNLVIRLNTAMGFFNTTGFVFVPEQGSGEV